jgi:hypothetical protein
LADLEFGVVLFESDVSKLEGRTFVVPGTQPGPTPHVWLKWNPAPDASPQSLSFTTEYALRLEFGRVEGGKLPGRIYLCAPDVEKSFVRGTFELPVD